MTFIVILMKIHFHNINNTQLLYSSETVKYLNLKLMNKEAERTEENKVEH